MGESWGQHVGGGAGVKPVEKLVKQMAGCRVRKRPFMTKKPIDSNIISIVPVSHYRRSQTVMCSTKKKKKETSNR